MESKKYLKNTDNIHNSLLTLFLYFAVHVNAVADNTVTTAPPPVEIRDRFGINLAVGQPEFSQKDLGIGGDLGLSHYIYSHNGGEFVGWESPYSGFKDNFLGVLRSRHFPDKQEYRIIVHGANISEQFKIIDSGKKAQAVGDTRIFLEYISGTGYVLTGVDGTQVIFPAPARDESKPFDEPGMLNLMGKIIYPNGKAIKIQRSLGKWLSVTSNTGYQLKYIYEPKNDSGSLVGTSNPEVPESTSGWWDGEPRRIVGLNVAYEYCAPWENSCELEGYWPTVEYDWPDHMPRAMYVSEGIFKVTEVGKNGEQRITEYLHSPIDEATETPSGWLLGVEPGEYSHPRITKVLENGVEKMTFTYANKYYVQDVMAGLGLGYAIHRPKYFARIKSAIRKTNSGNDSATYEVAIPKLFNGYVGELLNAGGGIQSGGTVSTNPDTGGVISADMWDKKIRFNGAYGREVSSIFYKKGGYYEHYKYDARGNSIWKKINNSYYPEDGNGPVAESNFPELCENRKTCNKPTWASDYKGNKTYFDYHEASGQIKKITYPKNSDGLSKVEYFEYSTYYAKERDSSGALVRSQDPIWLLERKTTCKDSEFIDGVCAAGDEVITSYEYEENNLLLIGKATSSDGEILRTCFQYDKYGRKIGVISAKAELANCVNI